MRTAGATDYCVNRVTADETSDAEATAAGASVSAGPGTVAQLRDLWATAPPAALKGARGSGLMGPLIAGAGQPMAVEARAAAAAGAAAGQGFQGAGAAAGVHGPQGVQGEDAGGTVEFCGDEVYEQSADALCIPLPPWAIRAGARR